MATRAMLGALSVAVAGAAPGVMGPLLNDTTAADGCGVISPGGKTTNCTDLGVYADAVTCRSACANTTWCSAVTFHGPTTGAWANHCLAVRTRVRRAGIAAAHTFRVVQSASQVTNNDWEPAGCGNGCDHTSSQKTSGWEPKPPFPWGPTVTGVYLGVSLN